MNKDLLIVFTKGIDEYNLNKQLKTFKESTIIKINSEPDYFTLYNFARTAYEDGYNSFHYLTESENWAELDNEFKKEFFMFESAGVIKGNYGRARLREGDTNQQTQNQNQQQNQQQSEPILVIFPANYASFNGEEMKQGFAQVITTLPQKDPNLYLILPLPQTQNQNKSVGLTAGEAFELFEDITKYKIKDCFLPNNIIATNIQNPTNLLGIVKGKNPIYIGPTDLASTLHMKIEELQGIQTSQFNPDPRSDTFNKEYNGNLNNKEIFTNQLAQYIDTLKSQSMAEPLTEEDKGIINNIGNELKTDKDKYVNQCFNISIYNITNNIDITNNTQINVNIVEINAENGMAALGQAMNALLDVNGNLEATQGTIYNAGIRALQYGAQRTFTQRDKFLKAGAEGKAAFNKMTGGLANVDDSYETDKLNKSQLLNTEVNNQSGTNARAKQDARLSQANIKDTNKKIEILKQKKIEIEQEIKSADEKEKKGLENIKKEVEQELANAYAQLNAYSSHQSHNQQFGDIEKIKQNQLKRDNTASGLNGTKNNPYSNMGNESDKTKVQKAKNIKEREELNQKMNVKLLSKDPQTKRSKLDELKDTLK